MKIALNGTPCEVHATCLAQVLVECGMTGQVATAVNADFVPVSLRAGFELKEGDRLEVVAPMQGG